MLKRKIWNKRTFNKLQRRQTYFATLASHDPVVETGSIMFTHNTKMGSSIRIHIARNKWIPCNYRDHDPRIFE